MEKSKNDDDYYKSDDFNFFKPKKINTINSLNNEEKLNINFKHTNANKKLSELSDEEKANYRKLSKNSNDQFNSVKKDAYAKSIKDSNRAIYEEPIQNFEGYFSKGN